MPVQKPTAHQPNRNRRRFTSAIPICKRTTKLSRPHLSNSSSPGFRRASSTYISEEELAHARVLGLRGTITFDDVKRSYRERMHEYHLDKVNSLGQKLRELADSEAKKINAAYEFFRRKYDPNA